MITFGEGAEDALVRIAQAIPTGYTVGLVRPGQELIMDVDIVRGQDVSFVRADDYGVWFWPLTKGADRDQRHHYPLCLPWADLDRIHIY